MSKFGCQEFILKSMISCHPGHALSDCQYVCIHAGTSESFTIAFTDVGIAGTD